jgi:PAS domain S-box-containing protein
MVNKPPARRKGADIGLESTHATDQLLNMPVAAVIDALPDAAFLYEARGRIAHISPAARRLFALDAMPGFDALPLEQRIALLKPRDPDGHPLPTESWHLTRLLAGETISDADPLVARVTALDGRELVFSFTGAPIRGDDGAVIGALAIGRDVTAYYDQRIQREEVLLHEQLLRAQIEDVYAEAEAARAQAQARAAQLEAIIQTVPSRISIFGPDGAITRMNRAAQSQAGPDRGGERLDEVQAIYDLRTSVGEPFPREQLPVARALRGETVTGVELLTRDADGGEQVMLASAAPILDPAGVIQGAVSVAHDITTLRAAERAAAERAGQLDGIFQAITDGIFVYDCGGSIISANAAARELLALDALPAYDSLPIEERKLLFAPSDKDGHLLAHPPTPITDALHGTVLKGEKALDLILRRMDGRLIDVNLTAAPIRDAGGAIIGAVSILRDMSQSRRLEQRARRALDALLAMAEAAVTVPHTDEPEEHAPDGHAEPRDGAPSPAARALALLARDVLDCARVAIVAVDDGQRLMPIAVAGLDAGEEEQWQGMLRGVPLATFLDADLVAHLSAGEAVAIDTTPSPRADASFGTTAALLAPMRIADRLIGILSLDSGKEVQQYTEHDRVLAGAVARLAALVVERERLLRERAAAQAQVLALTEANRRMDDFLGIAAHELRTPLTTTRANAQIALRSLRDAAGVVPPATLARLESLVTRIEQQSYRQERLVSDLVDVSRIAGGRLELEREPTDLAAVARETVEEQRLLNPNRTITLAAPPTGHAHTVPVVADADRVAQVITNYLTNALKYSHSHQPVEVSVGVTEDGAATVRVRDHGPGVPEQESDRVWERFHRVPGIMVRSGSGIGLGLGLYIAREIVVRHGGRVGVERAPGHGATFWFTLPAAPDSADPAEPAM